MSNGTTREGAILAGGFQKVFENLALVDIFRICSTTKNQRFSRGFSKVFDLRFLVDIFRIFSMLTQRCFSCRKRYSLFH